ncbi:MAG: hypothetical protein NTY87_07540 [Planctomycetia bacterium]|nr:hypothetical protein [Planctomycetia bacterium]
MNGLTTLAVIRAALVGSFAVALVLSATAEVAVAQDRSLPFSNIYTRPVVSPYSMLSSQANSPLMVNPNVYQTQVLPQLQQQRQQQTLLTQNKQIGGLQNKVQSIQRSTSARQIDEMIRPTGHASTFMNMSHYYPRSR